MELKKKCLIYGNCQADALKLYFDKYELFRNKYEIVPLKAVHLLVLNDIEFLLNQIKDVDLFIHQPISENYKNIPELGSEFLKSKLKKDAIVISFPVLYFKGYNPEIIGLKDLNNKTIAKPISYWDQNILLAAYKGNNKAEILNKVEKGEIYTRQQVLDNFNSSLEELKRREQNLDIKMSSFLENNYKLVKLFHVFNHPNNFLLHNLTNSILSLALDNHKEIEFDEIKFRDILSRTSFVVGVSIYKNLELAFENSTTYKIDNEYYNTAELIDLHIEFVLQNKTIVAENLKRNLLI